MTFAGVLIRVLAIVGFTLIPFALVNLWFQEEVFNGVAALRHTPAELRARYEWLRVTLLIVAISLSLAFTLACIA